MRAHALTELARGRHRIITRDDFVAAGYDARQWYRCIDTGALVLVHPRVAVAAGTAITPLVRIAGAVALARPGSMAGLRSGAFLWDHDITGDAPIDVISLDRGTRLHIPGVVHHRPTDLTDLRPVMRHGIPCANPLRCLVDLGSVAPDAVYDFLTHLRVQKLVSLDAAKKVLDRRGGRGRPGISALRRAIRAQALADGAPDSTLELAMDSVVRRFRLPKMQFHAWIAGFEVDFWVIDTPVVLECLGWGAHGNDREQFDYDKNRTAALLAAGYVVLPLVWNDIVNAPARTAAQIRDVVDRWGIPTSPA
jgi:very-short-patch-repair endonuclease